MAAVSTHRSGRHGDGLAPRSDRGQKTGQAGRPIFAVVQHIVDDLALHHDPEERFEVAVTIGRAQFVFDGRGVHRDRRRSRERDSHDRLAVGPDFIEAAMVAADRGPPAFQFMKAREVLVDMGAEAGSVQASPHRVVLVAAQALVVPGRIGARAKIQERRQGVDALAWHLFRVTQQMTGVERGDAQDAERGFWGVAKKEREMAKQGAAGTGNGAQSAIRHDTARLREDTASESAPGR